MGTRAVRYVALMVVLAAVFAGCGSSLTADSTCADYVNASRDEQTAAAQKVAQQTGVAYSPLVQGDVDAKCSTNPDASLRLAVSGRSLPQGDGSSGDGGAGDESGGGQGAQPLSYDTPCQEFVDAPEDVQTATADKFLSDGAFRGLTEPAAIDFLTRSCGPRDSKPASLTLGDLIQGK
jgi:hypothetical protein